MVAARPSLVAVTTFCLAFASARVATAATLELAPLPASPAVQETRGRATGTGAVLGGALLGAAGLVLGAVLCAATDGADDDLCPDAGSTFRALGTFTLFGALGGAAAGASIGAAIPRNHAGPPSFIWQRASGPIGTLAFQLGANRVMGEGNVQAASPALRTALLARLGECLAVGPELGLYPQARHERPDQPSSPAGRPLRDLQRMVLSAGLALRLGEAMGAFYPYVIAGAGAYVDYGDLVGSVGLGAEYALGPSFGVGVEARLHGGGSSRLVVNGPFLATTAGVSWRW